jgi:HPt (histidine-containing phosphotransfer) domain-containing protein
MGQGESDINEEGDKWFSGIEGIDPKVGLESSGSEDSFKSVMKIFYNSIDSRADEIEGYYDSEDWENYTIKVHALKSSARLVGAVKLSKDSEDLERAGKENKIDFIKENTADLLVELRSFKEPLSKVFGEACGMEDLEAMLGIDVIPAIDDIPATDVSSDPGNLADSDKEALSGQSETGAETQEAGSPCEFDDFLMKSMYEAIEQGVDQKNEALLAGTFKEMADYQLPECCIATVEKLKEHFKNLDYEAMKKVLVERGKGH